jgi:hypothetical protein
MAEEPETIIGKEPGAERAEASAGGQTEDQD